MREKEIKEVKEVKEAKEKRKASGYVLHSAYVEIFRARKARPSG